jgi:hypothetical protein
VPAFTIFSSQYSVIIKTEERRLTSEEMCSVRRIVGYVLLDHKSNDKITRELQNPQIPEFIEYRRNCNEHYVSFEASMVNRYASIFLGNQPC